MATRNFFALLSDNELDDPWAVVTPVSASEKPAATTATAKKPSAPSAAQQPKLPSKPLSPGEAVRASRNFQNGGRGRGEGARGGRGNYRDRNYSGRDGRPEGVNTEGRNPAPRSQIHNVDFTNTNIGDTNFVRGAKTGNYRGGRGNAYGGASRGFNGDHGDSIEVGHGWSRGRGRGRGDGERIRKQEFKHSEVKGDGNDNDIVTVEASQEQQRSIEEKEKKTTIPVEDKQPKIESSDNVALADGEEKIKKAEEDNEMTLDEYEKILDEKRKALAALKHVERKVNADKAFGSMQLMDKKSDDDIFIKLGFEKEKSRKKEATDKEEKTRKPVSINEFLKPIDGEPYQKSFAPRGRGRGRGNRGGNQSSFAANFGSGTGLPVPSIEDPGQFPTLGGN